MSDRYYRALRTLAAPFAFRCIGAEHIAGNGPAVFIANHLGSIGPIEAILSVPVRFHPWIRAEMMDLARGPDYLYDDFVHPVWHLKGQTGMILARILSRIAIGIFHSIDAVSVPHSSRLHLDTFRRSLSLLLEDRNLLVFPEDPDTLQDPTTGLRTFMGGFVQICQMYEHRTNTPLPVYPMAVSATRKAVLIGPAFFAADGSETRVDTREIRAAAQAQVHALLQRLEAAPR